MKRINYIKKKNLKDRRIAILEYKLEYQRKRNLNLLEVLKYKDNELKKYEKFLAGILELAKLNDLL